MGDEVKTHEKSIEDIFKEFNPAGEKGLTQQRADDLLLQFGPNELEKPKRVSLLMLFVIQLNSVIMYLLMAAVVASAAIKATSKDNAKFITYIDAIAILIIVFINATIAAVTENNANDALDALSSLQQAMATVIRDGEEKDIESSKIVPGDILKLKTGDVVPADIRNIQASDFRVNEMLLTGEPEDVAKNTVVKPRIPGHPEKLTADNMAFSSCNVKAGTCVGIVVATGMKTRVGSIAALLNQAGSGEEEMTGPASDIEAGAPKKKPKKEGCLPDTKSGQSPLQANLEALAVKLGYMAIGVCLVVFIVGAAMGTKDPEMPETPSWLFMILVAVTLTVAAIPEGLPLCVTIALSSGCSDMANNENVMMRKIAAVETLGSASIICTDKTGTLTEGKMTLIAMHAGGIDFTVTGKGFDPTVGKITTTHGDQDANSAGGVVATLGSAVLCSDTKLTQETDADDSTKKKWVPKGNSSEAPLIVAGQKIGITKDALEKAQPQTYQIPFSSSRKMMVTITKTSGDSILKHCAPMGEYTAHIKGAPNYIMDKCTKYMDKDGQELPLDAAAKQGFMDKVDELSEQALRVLAVATVKIGPVLPYSDDEDTDAKFAKLVKDCTFCGMCASIDPERDGVKDAVKTSRVAGVRVVMITGDYLKTAIAIAKNINILNKQTFVEGSKEALDCGDLRPESGGGVYLANQDIDALTSTTNVFARAKPEDKLEIVKSLQRQGKVCAMTGDGVNDAPALQKADIGVAMGLEGTEVAKGASDMILMDDNFCSIVKAIENGRKIYAGIQKFVSFIMSVHFAEVLQIFLCIVCSIPVMRQPLQILFLILVTDLPPSIALGFEPCESLTMQRKPRPKEQPVVMMWMWRGIVANGVILTICIFCTYLLCLWAYAGAFQTDDITSPLRAKCTIWDKSMTPSLDYKCEVPDNQGLKGRFRPCTTLKTDAAKAWMKEQEKEFVECFDDVKLLMDTVSYKTLVEENVKAAKELAKNNAEGTDEAADAAEKSTDSQMEQLFKNRKTVFVGEGEVSLDTFINGMHFNYGSDADNLKGCTDCIEKSIRRARTAAFISLVWAEGFRAYCSRSFENGVWVDTFNNPSMNKAVAMAQVTLMIALFLPGLNQDVLGLYVYEIQGFGWFLAFIGALSCLVFCELYKVIGAKFVEQEALAGYTENADGTVDTKVNVNT
jgi:potassium/sodium efflux P-type ATPase